MYIKSRSWRNPWSVNGNGNLLKATVPQGARKVEHSKHRPELNRIIAAVSAPFQFVFYSVGPYSPFIAILFRRLN